MADDSASVDVLNSTAQGPLKSIIPWVSNAFTEAS